EDKARWSAEYLTWCRYLKRRFGIDADEGCTDWTRLYRLPFVARDDKPTIGATAGDAYNIGTWVPDLEPDDIVAPVAVTTRPAGERKVFTGDLDDIHSYARAALEGECATFAAAPKGIRNTTLNRAAFKLGTLVGSGHLPRDLVEDRLLDAAKENG